MMNNIFPVELTKEEIEKLQSMIRVRIFDAAYIEKERDYVTIFQKLVQALKRADNKV